MIIPTGHLSEPGIGYTSTTLTSILRCFNPPLLVFRPMSSLYLNKEASWLYAELCAHKI